MKTTDEADVAEEESNIKGQRVRSPAYPSMGLEDAIAKAKILYSKESQGRHPIAAPIIARDWGYKSLNGSALTAISALKQFGILVEQDVADGKPRELKLSEHALNLVVRKPDSAEWKSSARAVALRPKLYARLWKKYDWPLPSDESIHHYLELDEKFNAKYIPSIIKDYKRTIAIANVVDPDKIEDRQGGEPPDEKVIEIGDFIQWESQGAARFPVPRRVTGKTDDGSHLFVENERCGVPIEQAVLAQAPAEKVEPAMNAQVTKQTGEGSQVPPVNPAFKPNVAQKDFPSYLSNNQKAVLYVPATMSKKDYELLKRQIENHLSVIEATSIADDSTN